MGSGSGRGDGVSSLGGGLEEEGLTNGLVRVIRFGKRRARHRPLHLRGSRQSCEV